MAIGIRRYRKLQPFGQGMVGVTIRKAYTTTGNFHWDFIMVKKKFTLPKLDIFQIQFLVWLVLFTSQRRFEWCIELIVSFNEAEVFRIFHDEMKNQKVVRLTTGYEMELFFTFS